VAKSFLYNLYKLVVSIAAYDFSCSKDGTLIYTTLGFVNKQVEEYLNRWKKSWVCPNLYFVFSFEIFL